MSRIAFDGARVRSCSLLYSNNFYLVLHLGLEIFGVRIKQHNSVIGWILAFSPSHMSHFVACPTSIPST